MAQKFRLMEAGMVKFENILIYISSVWVSIRKSKHSLCLSLCTLTMLCLHTAFRIMRFSLWQTPCSLSMHSKDRQGQQAWSCLASSRKLLCIASSPLYYVCWVCHLSSRTLRWEDAVSHFAGKQCHIICRYGFPQELRYKSVLEV